MAQTQTQAQNNSSTNGNGEKRKRDPKPVTAIDAISKIGKILDQLSPNDRKRVLAFVNESGEETA